MKGVDYGVTVGICLKSSGVAWFDLVVMSGCVPKYHPLFFFWYTRKLMKSPERYLAMPIYSIGHQPFSSSKVGEVTAPLVTRLDVDDVFDGHSLCILDYVMEADNGCFDEPLYMMVVVKKGVKAKHDGWICEYDKKLKVVMLNENDSTKANHQPPEEKTRPHTGLRPEDDFLTDLTEADFSGVPSSRWNESAKEESDSIGGDTPDAKNMRDTFLVSEDDRKDMTQQLRGVIDEARYVVYTSRRLNKMTVRWRDHEKRAFQAQHREAVGKLKAIPGAKTLQASRTSNVAKHTLAGCLRRAREWQNWHSYED